MWSLWILDSLQKVLMTRLWSMLGAMVTTAASGILIVIIIIQVRNYCRYGNLPIILLIIYTRP